MPALIKHNYRALYEEFLHLRTQNPLTLEAYCTERSYNYKHISAKFVELRREAQLETYKRRNPTLLLKAQSIVSKSLDSESLKEDFKADYALNAFKAIADREGFSPQAQTINIKNSAQALASITVVPLFGEEPEQFKELLGGTE